MPDQETQTAARAGCPTCHEPLGARTALVAPGGAPLTPNGRVQPPHPAGDSARPADAPAAPPVWHLPTYSLQFWQGLAVGLAAGIVILFLVALAA